MKIADELENRFDEIAKLESRDTGKPISLAKKVDANRSVNNFRFFANLVDGIEMAREGYREKHGLKTRFRLTSANQGLIDGEFSVEHEEVVVGSNCI